MDSNSWSCRIIRCAESYWVLLQVLPFRPVTLTFSDMCYYVPVPKVRV